MSNNIYMRRALSLALKGLGSVSTNPMVGAVIVCEGQIIGEGYHHTYGEAHAEVNAVNSVKEKELLHKSTLYVTLEPCCHYGKTPPCTDLIIRSGIPNVVVAMSDPFAKVAGEGIKKLQQNGVSVIVGMLREEAEFLNRRFITFHTKKRPYIILKWAETADGYLDSDRSQSEAPLWLTGKTARTLVHRWRAEEDAIMVGANTVIRDNPQLTVRDWFGKNPIRVTIDGRGDLPKTAKIFDNQAQTICYSTNDIPQIVADLYANNVQSLLVEGGTKTLQQFIDCGYCDEIRRFRSDRTLSEFVGRASKGVKSPQFSNFRLLSSEKLATNCLEFFLTLEEHSQN